MKAFASILAMLAFVATAYADDMAKDSAAPMKSEAMEQSATPAAAAEAAPVTGTVARSTFTRDVENHEPIDQIKDLTTNTGKIYYFTELRDMDGQTVTHRWEHNGEVMAEVSFDVGGPRWRVYSSKNLMPNMTGEWKVSVVAANGATLDSDTFMYTEAPAPSAESGTMSKDMTAGTAMEDKPQAPNSQ